MALLKIPRVKAAPKDPEASRRGGRERPPRSDREECERCGRPMATRERSRDVERDQLPSAESKRIRPSPGRGNAQTRPRLLTHHLRIGSGFVLDPLRLPEMVETTRLPEPGREHDEDP